MDIAPKKRLQEIIDSLPVLPTTAANVLEITASPESSAQDLMNAILPDQSMCLAILKIANSALFGQPKQVKSIERAVMVLGFNEVQSIVLSKAVIDAFADYSGDHKETIDRLWAHSFSTGLVAKTIAEHMNLPGGDLFIGGLIHDIGKLIMFLAEPDKYDSGVWLTGLSNEEKMVWERKVFAADHTMIGWKVLQAWSFPNMLLNAVRFHHDPEGAGRGQGYPLIIQLADCLAHLSEEPEMLEEMSLVQALDSYLPGIKTHWLKCGLKWDEMVLESWLAWLKIDSDHGGSIMAILSSKKKLN